MGYNTVIPFVAWYGSFRLLSQPQDGKIKMIIFQDVSHLLELFYLILQWQIMHKDGTVEQVNYYHLNLCVCHCILIDTTPQVDWLHPQNVFLSLRTSRCIWEDAECKLKRFDFRRELHCRRAFQLGFGVTEISEDKYRGIWDLWWLVQEYHGSDYEWFGKMWERRRESGVDLGVSPYQCAHHKPTLSDGPYLMDTYSEDCRRHLRFSRFTKAVNFPQQWIWCMDYRSLALLNNTI